MLSFQRSACVFVVFAVLWLLASDTTTAPRTTLYLFPLLLSWLGASGSESPPECCEAGSFLVVIEVLERGSGEEAS